MAKKRQYGEGSVYQRASDGLWIGTLDIGWTAAGTRRRKIVSGKTEAIAKRRLRDLRLQIERDGATDVSSKATVKSWAEEWLRIQEGRLGPSSFNTTRSAVAKWIVPAIGHKRFDLLTPRDIRAVRDAQRREGRAGSTQLRTHSVLQSMLKAATVEGHHVPPRLLLVDAPQKSTSDRSDMSVPQALAVLDQATRLPHGSRYLAALLQGTRQGESLGMTWPEVDLDRGMWRVSWQLKALSYRIAYDRTSGFRVPAEYEARQLQGALHLVRPKSASGYRIQPLVEPMAAALRAWREVAPDSPHGLVWPDLDGGPTDNKTDDAEWYGLQEAAEVGHKAGRYYTIHEARHTTATLLLEAGVPAPVIIQIIGHSSYASTTAYTHVNVGPAHEALSKVAERLQLVAPPAS